MTTCIFDRRRAPVLVADTQNTDNGGAIYRANKIIRLRDGRWFMGAGNCYLIGATMRWAESKFAIRSKPAEYACLFEHGDDYDFTCLIVSPDAKRATLVDVEMEPLTITDAYFGIGSGAAYALGAMDAGASATDAVGFACNRDGNSSLPLQVVRLNTETKRKPR